MATPRFPVKLPSLFHVFTFFRFTQRPSQHTIKHTPSLCNCKIFIFGFNPKSLSSVFIRFNWCFCSEAVVVIVIMTMVMSLEKLWFFYLERLKHYHRLCSILDFNRFQSQLNFLISRSFFVWFLLDCWSFACDFFFAFILIQNFFFFQLFDLKFSF